MKERLKVLSVMLMILSISLSAISCSKDDDEKDSNTIVGTWKYKSVAAGEIKTNNTTNDEKIKPFVISEGVDSYIGFWFEFKADGTVRSSYEDETPMTGTYTLSNGTLTIKDGDETYFMKVIVDNGILIIERDYAEDCNDLELDKLIELGISDPVNFKATKAIANISFNRQ